MEAAARRGLDVDVPTCPGWTVRDLLLHLGRIHREKALTVREGVTDRDFHFKEPASDVVEWFEEGAELMLAALRSKDATDPAWTWHGPDQTVGFWNRRMAHETLIHRVDAELAHGEAGEVDHVIAEDGIDEALEIFIGGYPDWATPRLGDRVIRLSTSGRSWWLRAATFSGTTRSGRVLEDVPTVVLESESPAADCEITGDPAALDLWLWGRAPVSDLTVSGDAELAAYLRNVAAKST